MEKNEIHVTFTLSGNIENVYAWLDYMEGRAREWDVRVDERSVE